MFALRVDDSGWRWCWLCLVICQSNVKSISHKRQLLRYISEIFLSVPFNPIQFIPEILDEQFCGLNSSTKSNYLNVSISADWSTKQTREYWFYVKLNETRKNCPTGKYEPTKFVINTQHMMNEEKKWRKKWKIAHNYNSSDEMGLSTRWITDKCINHQKPNHARFVCHFERVLNSEDFGILEKKRIQLNKWIEWTAWTYMYKLLWMWTH